MDSPIPRLQWVCRPPNFQCLHLCFTLRPLGDPLYCVPPRWELSAVGFRIWATPAHRLFQHLEAGQGWWVFLRETFLPEPSHFFKQLVGTPGMGITFHTLPVWPWRREFILLSLHLLVRKIRAIIVPTSPGYQVKWDGCVGHPIWFLRPKEWPVNTIYFLLPASQSWHSSAISYTILLWTLKREFVGWVNSSVLEPPTTTRYHRLNAVISFVSWIWLPFKLNQSGMFLQDAWSLFLQGNLWKTKALTPPNLTMKTLLVFISLWVPFSVTSEKIAWSPLTLAQRTGYLVLSSSLPASNQRHFLVFPISYWEKMSGAERIQLGWYPHPIPILRLASGCPLAGGIDPLVRGLLAKNAKLMHQNKMMTGELRNKLFQPNHTIHGFDLASINIQRSRDHGQPGEWVWGHLVWRPGAPGHSLLEPGSQSILELEAFECFLIFILFILYSGHNFLSLLSSQSFLQPPLFPALIHPSSVSLQRRAGLHGYQPAMA